MILVVLGMCSGTVVLVLVFHRFPRVFLRFPLRSYVFLPPRGLGATGSPELTGPGRGLVGKSCCPSGWWAGFVNRGFGPWAGLPTQPRGAPHGVTQGAAPHPHLGCGVPEELWRARQAFPSGTCRGPDRDPLWANPVVPFGACGGTQCPPVPRRFGPAGGWRCSRKMLRFSLRFL